MSEWTCPGCGAEMETAHDGDDPFTSFSVNHHGQDGAVDFAVSVCAECALDAVATLAAWYHERQEAGDD